MKSTAKAEAIIRDVADKLKVRFAGSATIDTVRVSKDSAGWPMIICSDAGNEAAGQPVIAIRMKAADAVSKDVFGNDLVAFAPHTIELAYELQAANNPTPSDADLATAVFETVKTGVRYQQKQIANTVAVTAAAMDAASAIADLDELYWPSKGV